MKTFFMNDYGEGAHPIVMQRLLETNMEHTCGYGLDDYSLRAADVIREKCGQPGAAVHIMVGGTSANSIAIAAFLRPYEAAICAPTGHINVHETGAVEATGHKVLPCAAKDGKVTPEGVEAVCALHTDEHMVAPRLLYISQPTEIGTVYHLDELKALITAGVGTFVCMHMDADIVKALQEDNRCNVLCMGHMGISAGSCSHRRRDAYWRDKDHSSKSPDHRWSGGRNPGSHPRRCCR